MLHDGIGAKVPTKMNTMNTTKKPTTNLQSTTAVENEPVAEPETGSAAELSRLREENQQLRTTMRVTAARRQITDELAAAGARSPELLFDAVKGDLQFAEDGSLQNAAAITAMLRKRYPEQFGTQALASIDAAAGVAQPPKLTKEALARMSPSEITALDWDDVRRVLSR